MNKKELIDKVAAKAGMTKKQAGEAVEAVLEAIVEALKSGEEVRLVGFGTFRVVEMKAREGRNPQTGEKIKIPARKVVKFRPGRALEL